MRIGVHMKVSKGLDAAARLAGEIGCETIQVFAANPSAWRSGRIDQAEAESFQRMAAALDLRPVSVHTQYLLNLASPDPEIYRKSVSALADAMERAALLDAQYVVTHIGSHRGMGMVEGISRVCRAVSDSLSNSAEGVTLLLENSAGAGDSVGSKFGELRAILDAIGEHRERLGICLDTAHLWGAGYDVSTLESVRRTFDEFDSAVGLSRLQLIHLNDTHVELGSRRDRHANIGVGRIGERGFAAILGYPALKEIAGVIETPAKTIEDDIHDITVLKLLRGD